MSGCCHYANDWVRPIADLQIAPCGPVSCHRHNAHAIVLACNGRRNVRWLVAVMTGALVVSCSPADVGHLKARMLHSNIKVLDGDTLIFDGKLVHIAGIDAPELGPWAKCWAEAALGGDSRDALESAVAAPSAGTWKLTNVSQPDEVGRVSAHLVRADGEDLGDLMVVGGHAARTTGRWNWCGADANLHQPLEGEPPPRGPSLWWPSNEMYDERAHD